MRILCSIAVETSADSPPGALDSGGWRCTQAKQKSSKAFPLTRDTAHGIIVPLLYTANDARNAVQAAKFPPIGTRGFGSQVSPRTSPFSCIVVVA